MSSIEIKINRNHSNFCTLTHRHSDRSISKTFPTEQVIQVMTSLTNSSLVYDSGILPLSLVRHAKFSNEDLYVFSEEEFVINPKVITDEASINVVNEHLKRSIINTCSVKPFEYDGEDEEDEELFIFSPFPITLKGITTLVKINRSGCYNYNVLHNYNPNSLDYSLKLTNDTVLMPTIFPNHFSDSICWGVTGFTEILHNAIKDKNLSIISTIPKVYFNSEFNNDLAYAAYGINVYLVPKSTFEEIFKNIYRVEDYDKFFADCECNCMLRRHSHNNKPYVQIFSLALYLFVIKAYYIDLKLYDEFMKFLYDFIDKPDGFIKYSYNRTLDQVIKNRGL